MNYELRKQLSIEIRKAMDSVTNKITLELKRGLDEAEFASIKVLTDDVDEINGHLETAKRCWDNSFWVYSDEIKRIQQKVEELRNENNVPKMRK